MSTPMDDKKLEEIRGRLAEWQTASKIRSSGKPSYEADYRYSLAVDDLQVNAPTDIAALLEEVERMKLCLHAMGDVAEDEIAAETAALKAENERLRGALKKCERMWRRAPTDTELARLNPNNECAWQLKLLDEVSAVARAALEGK